MRDCQGSFHRQIPIIAPQHSIAADDYGLHPPARASRITTPDPNQSLTAPMPTLPASLRLVTYNIQKCFGMDLRRRPDRIMQVLEGTGAQIAVLQEVDKRLAPRPAALPAFALEEAGWHVADLGGAASLGWHGNAVIWRGGDLSVRNLDHITLPGLEPRGAVRVEFDTEFGPLRIIGAHLGLIAHYRRQQLLYLTENTKSLPEMPTVWAGDFNDWSTRSLLENCAPHMRFLPPIPSFPSPRPTGSLDRIAVGHGLGWAAHDVYRSRPAHIASDHLPIWADLQPTQ